MLSLSLAGAMVAFVPFVAEAQIAPSAVAITVPISGSSVSYGDFIDYDQVQGTYFISQYADDSRIFGVAVQNPPLVLLDGNQGEVPVLRSGSVLANVTAENGPIKPGDGIVASSIPGKGMRANAASKNIFAIARESFAGNGTSTLMFKGRSIPAGTIVVELKYGLGQGENASSSAAAAVKGCSGGQIPCLIAQKIDATPVVTLMRYILAAAVALGSIYLAFHSFMADAVNGVRSVGRNPRAKTAIQAMVVFNGLLAAFIALLGLGAGLLILFVQL